MTKRSSLLVFPALLLLALSILSAPNAAEPPKVEPEVDYSSQLPRIAPLSPADAMKSFEVHPGFRVEQVAAEPLVNSPVAVDFDENGRLFVCEMRDYSEQDKEHLGQIRLLEDTDEDGRFDKSTVFVDNLSWPTAVACANGGVFVGAAPDLFFFKDEDGDGKADVKKLIFTGFARSNVQGLLNSFQWGLDNRLHGASSTVGGEIRRVDDPKSKVISVRGRDFAINTRTLDFATVSGGAQHGMSFDIWGRKFDSSNSDHIQLVMYEDRYLARNPYLAAPSARLSIASDGPQAEVYRISPVEPWRIIRTKLRVEKKVIGVVEGGGRPAGYFTGATGVTIYRGDAWPEANRGNAFIGDVGSNIMHRKVLEPKGVELVANRVDAGKEFVASRDTWFRPAQFANAPDGNLYICDVYREVIEHPHSIPPEIKKHLDLTSGRDRGRLYRVVAEGYKQQPLPKLGKATTAELVALLAHPNGWHRQTASRLIFEQNDKVAVPLLLAMASESKSPLGRMHALRALDGFGAVTPQVVLARLADEHPRVREHAVQLAERVTDSSDVQARLCSLAADEDLRVRYQLAYTLGELKTPDRLTALATIARRDSDDRWMRLAMLSSLVDGAGAVLSDLVADAKYRTKPAAIGMLEALAMQVGAQHRDVDVAAVLKAVDVLSDGEISLQQGIIRGLAQGLSKAGDRKKVAELRSNGGKAGKLFASLIAAARANAANEKLAATARIQAVQALALGSLADDKVTLAALLDHHQPQEVQLAALTTLARFNEPEAAQALIDAWPRYTPRLRTEAVEALVSRPAWIGILLDAVEASKIQIGDIDSTRVKLLTTHSNKTVRERSEKLFSSAKLARRQEVVDAYRDVLAMKGSTDNGRVTFRKICAACHRLESFGHEIGPSLLSMKNRGSEAILLNVLDPNREVNPQYVNYIVITNAGRSFTGMIASENATSVVLKRAENATDTVLRIDIDELLGTGLSIMPEGMEKQVDKQTMADLIAYLNSI